MVGPTGTRLPPLSALRAFEAVARLGSVAAAAGALAVTASAISHQLASLEAWFERPLLRREGRRLALTQEGALLFPSLRDGFERIQQGVALLDRERGGDLTLQVYVTVAVRWLMAKLHRFQALRPAIRVRLATSQLDWEFDPAIADLGIVCTADPTAPGLHYTPLFAARLVPVCARSVAQAGLGLRQPADLVNQTLLKLYTAEGDWQVWLKAADLSELPGRDGPKFDSYLLALEAAMEGQGVALVPHFLVREDLKSGRLVQPFALTVKQPGDWYLVCRRARRDEAAIRHFQDWLIGEIAVDPALGPALGPAR